MPKVAEAIEQIESFPEAYYLANRKVDIFIGPGESIELTNEFMEAYDEDSSQDFTRITAKYK
jgi:hypothetical protein